MAHVLFCDVGPKFILPRAGEDLGGIMEMHTSAKAGLNVDTTYSRSNASWRSSR